MPPATHEAGAARPAVARSPSSSSLATSSAVPTRLPQRGGGAYQYIGDGGASPRRSPSPPSELALARAQVPASSSPRDAMLAYRRFRDAVRAPIGVLRTYSILGFLSSGTYGRVYKARLRADAPAATRQRRAAGPWNRAPHSEQADEDEEEEEGDEKGVYAIKKFKPDKEELSTYTGISQSAMREIAVSREG
jgi:cyclin-dependent kinase 8/11